jgi:hypothetical protein
MKTTNLTNLFGIDFKRFSLVGWKHEAKSKFHFDKDESGLHLVLGRYDFELYFNAKGGK